MNPKLIIVKKKINGNNTHLTITHFIVVDADNPKGYPSNFICKLPQRKGLLDDQTSRFGEIFKDKKIETAKRLLTKSLEAKHNSKTRDEIKKRLSLLDLHTRKK